MSDAASARYDSTTISLHWATAVLVIVLWTSGQVADFLPKGPLRTNGWSLHFALGFALAAVLVWRIVWRFAGPAHPPAAGSGLLHLLARTAHYGLYLLLIAVIGLGLANAFVRGVSLFDLASLPQLGDREWRKPLTAWHELAANLLLGLALLHAAAALAHHYILNDRLLLRMMPARRVDPRA